MPPEERLQRDCFEWVFRHEALHLSLRWLFHVPNGGARSKGEAGKLKGMGTRKGVVDVLQPFPGPGAPGLAIELKAPGQPLTPDQVKFLAEANQAGWVNGVCFTLKEFQRLVRRYLAIPDHVRMD